MKHPRGVLSQFYLYAFCDLGLEMREVDEKRPLGLCRRDPLLADVCALQRFSVSVPDGRYAYSVRVAEQFAAFGDFDEIHGRFVQHPIFAGWSLTRLGLCSYFVLISATGENRTRRPRLVDLQSR